VAELAAPDKVSALGNPQAIRGHFADEFKVNALLDVTAQSRAMMFRWERLSNLERRQFIVQRDEVVKHVDQLAARAPETVSPLVRDAYQKARTDWIAVRPGLERLGL
jgi:hypothetical protein